MGAAKHSKQKRLLYSVVPNSLHFRLRCVQGRSRRMLFRYVSAQERCIIDRRYLVTYRARTREDEIPRECRSTINYSMVVRRHAGLPSLLFQVQFRSKTELKAMWATYCRAGTWRECGMFSSVLHDVTNEVVQGLSVRGNGDVVRVMRRGGPVTQTRRYFSTYVCKCSRNPRVAYTQRTRIHQLRRPLLLKVE